MTHVEVEAFDLRYAATHEAAHVVVARRLGLPADAALRRNPGIDHRENTWIGTTSLRARPTRGEGRLIGLAGWIAELVLDDREIEAEAIVDYGGLGMVEGGLSQTDHAMCPGPTEHDVRETLALVREAWQEIEAEAALLATEAKALLTAIDLDTGRLPE